jgi:endonuclease-3
LQLNHPIIGNNQQLSRAQNSSQGDLPYTPTYKNYNFNSSNSNIKALIPHISKVRNFGTKANWIIEIAETIQSNENIPLTMEKLTALKGIGRKSANVIIRETNSPAEGIIGDLHVIRVAPRIGLCTETKDGNKVEKQLMQILPKNIWNEIGMAISFLGREICRPTNPKCESCPINNHCQYNSSK